MFIGGKTQAALHALGNIAGETRPESNRLLNVDAEESLQALIYGTASRSPKLTPSVSYSHPVDLFYCFYSHSAQHFGCFGLYHFI